MTDNSRYQEGKLGEMISFIAGRFNLDAGYLRAVLGKRFPAIYDKKRCSNCDASMMQYKHSVSKLDGLLLLAMANVVRHRTRGRIPFTAANSVHIPRLSASYSVLSRATISSKLGLVAKYKNPDGKHKQGYWLITRRGWEALRGDSVPSQVVVGRSKIQERTDIMVTLPEIMAGQTIYKREDWIHYAGLFEGKLL